MTFIHSSLLVVSILLSCNSKSKTANAREIVVDDGNIKVCWYQEASAYSVSQMVTVTKGDSTIEVFKAAMGFPIGDVLINDKTILIQ